MCVAGWHTKYGRRWDVKPPMIMLFSQLMMTLKNNVIEIEFFARDITLLKRCELAESKEEDDERLFR